MSTQAHSQPPGIILGLIETRFQLAVMLISFCFIVIFGSSFYFLRPYDGLDFLIEDGSMKVTEVFTNGPGEKAGIRVGDSVLAIDGYLAPTWGNRPLYPFGIRAGESIIYEIQRGEEIVTIPLILASYHNNSSLLGAIIGAIILGTGIWMIGLVLSLFASKRDVRAPLIGLGWMIAGISMAVGIPGQLAYFWGADTIFKATWCGIAFTNVVSHLYFPAIHFSEQMRNRIIYATAGISILLFVLILVEDIILAPRFIVPSFGNLVYLWFLISVLVSLGLLLSTSSSAHHGSDARRQTGIVLWGTALGFAPFFSLTLLPLLLTGGRVEYIPGYYTVLAIILIPASYAYVIYQRKLLRIDLIINRAVVIFVLMLMILVCSILILDFISRLFNFPSLFPVWGGFVAAIVVLPSVALRERVQKRVNIILYGSHYDFSTVASTISSYLARTLDRSTLNNLLTQELPGQMAIQRAVLFLNDGKHLVLQGTEHRSYSISVENELCLLLLEAQVPVRAQYLWGMLSGQTEELWKTFSWGELFAPLVFEERLHGILILGERSSGDVYSDRDVQIIATVAYQAALAFANVQLVETLRGLTQNLVRSEEARRKYLARDLHDVVLQNLFLIQQRLHQSEGNAELVTQMDSILQALRRMIKTQRTIFLDQGLDLALKDLVIDMQKLAGDQIKISWSSEAEGRFELNDEQATSIYRIAQEALMNAIKHSQAKHISVKLTPGVDGGLKVVVEDDGIGISETTHTRVSTHQFGLLGMWERATMIHADLSVRPRKEKGTEVMVAFRPPF